MNNSDVNDKIINETVPIWKKLTLTINEANKYTGIGVRKLDELCKTPHCPFVIYIGRKKLIKRKEFEEYIKKNIEL